MQPNLDVFDDPRFSEWRRGDDCTMPETVGRFGGSCVLSSLVAWFFGFFGE